MHTWSHADLTTLSENQIVAEIIWTARIIKDVIGVTPNYLRPPYGSVDSRVRRIADGMGIRIVNWNRNSNDWQFSNYPEVKPSDPYNSWDTPDAIARTFSNWVNEPTRGTISLQVRSVPFFRRVVG